MEVCRVSFMHWKYNDAIIILLIHAIEIFLILITVLKITYGLDNEIIGRLIFVLESYFIFFPFE